MPGHTSFPRAAWPATSSVFTSPPFAPVIHDVVAAARDASERWRKSVAEGGVGVSERDYLLAVTDKAMELIEDDAARRKACNMDILAAIQGIAQAIAAAAKHHPAPLPAASVREFQCECLLGTCLPRPRYSPRPLSMDLVRASPSTSGVCKPDPDPPGPEITCACNIEPTPTTLAPELTITRVILPSSDGTRVGVFLPSKLARSLTRAKDAEAQRKCLAGMIAAVETLPVHIITHADLKAVPVWENSTVTVDHTSLRALQLDGLLVLFWRVVGDDGEHVRRAARRVDCAVRGYVAAARRYKLAHGLGRRVRREVEAFVRLATREECTREGDGHGAAIEARKANRVSGVNGARDGANGTVDSGVESLVRRLNGLTL